jgi:hypothetical protein
MVTDNLKAMKNKYIRLALFIGLFSFGFISCDDLADPIVKDLEFDRQFTPTRVTTSNGQTQATIQWSASLFSETGAVTYKVEVSKTLAFTVVEYSTTTSSLQAVITNQNIEIKQNHYARVKALGATEAEDSGWIVSGAFQITGEQIFLVVREADLAYNSVYLRWAAAGTDVTEIVLTPETGSASNYTITADEKTASAKTIVGLQPATGYTAEIFNGTTSRGTVSFTTFSVDVPDADLIIYLDGDDVFTQTTFDTLTATSVTFVFPQGSVYGADAALVLKGSTDFTFYGIPGANKPILAFNGFTLPSVGGKIKFENVDLTGFQYVEGVPTATKRAYIFNQSVASVTEEITFENCIIRNFANTPFRIQSANVITLEKFVANNCIVYDVSATVGALQTYAFINTNVATGKINNIELTNSTFYNLRIGLILHNAAPSQSVTISNCTVNDISDDARALVDYNAQAVTTFTFTANIIGKSKSALNTARGIRIAGTTVSVPSSTYITNDYITATSPIGGVTNYAGTNTELFEAPASGNFNFKDTNFAGKSTSGDPRWRQ